jgi:hypothetical protein
MDAPGSYFRFDRDDEDRRELDEPRLRDDDEDDDDRLRPLDALPPLRPPFRDEAVLMALPRPEPLFLPPPVSLLTVAQARRSASSFEVPRFS